MDILFKYTDGLSLKIYIFEDKIDFSDPEAIRQKTDEIIAGIKLTHKAKEKTDGKANDADIRLAQ